MINLIPPALKKQFVAGRVNTILVRYIWIVIMLLILLGVISALTYYMLDSARASAEERIKENNAETSSYQQVQARTTEFQSNLATAKTILDKQTYYSGALLKVVKYLIPGTVMDSISLDSSTYGTPMTLEIYALNENVAIDLKRSFQESNVLDDAHFQSLSLGTETKNINGKDYTVKITMTVTINKETVGNEGL